MSSVDWIQLLQTFGLAVVLLYFIGWAIVKVGIYLAPKLDQLFNQLFNGINDIQKFDSRLLQIEQRIETLWEFQLRRAAVEALQRGIGKMNSPIKINEEAKSWLGDLTLELKAFYRRLGRELTISQLAEEIERKYGDEIVKKICIPHGLSQGACLLIAMEVAREVETDLKVVDGNLLPETNERNLRSESS